MKRSIYPSAGDNAMENVKTVKQRKTCRILLTDIALVKNSYRSQCLPKCHKS